MISGCISKTLKLRWVGFSNAPAMLHVCLTRYDLSQSIVISVIFLLIIAMASTTASGHWVLDRQWSTMALNQYKVRNHSSLKLSHC